MRRSAWLIGVPGVLSSLHLGLGGLEGERWNWRTYGHDWLLASLRIERSLPFTRRLISGMATI
jgi:hypothetical protein